MLSSLLFRIYLTYPLPAVMASPISSRSCARSLRNSPRLPSKLASSVGGSASLDSMPIARIVIHLGVPSNLQPDPGASSSPLPFDFPRASSSPLHQSAQRPGRRSRSSFPSSPSNPLGSGSIERLELSAVPPVEGGRGPRSRKEGRSSGSSALSATLKEPCLRRHSRRSQP